MDILNNDNYQKELRQKLGATISRSIDMDIMEALGESQKLTELKIRAEQQEVIEEHWDEVIKFLKKNHPEDFI